MDHTEKYLKRAAQHHVVKAQHHRKMGAAIEKCTGMVKAAKSDLESLDVESLGELLQTFLDEHQAMADEHGQMAEECAMAAKEAQKADAGDLAKFASNPVFQEYVEKAVREAVGNTVVPTSVHAVVPAPPARAGLQAIPRFGSREVPTPVVEPQFAKLFDANPDSEDSLRQ
jgi:hypothetical protein